MFGAQLGGHGFQVRLRLRHGHARLHPAEDGEEREVARRLVGVVELQRLPDLRIGHEKGLGRQPQPSGRRQHADHGLVQPVEPDASSDDGRVAAVAGRPEAVAEDHDRRSAGGLFFGGEVTAVQRIDPHGREEVGGDGRNIHPLDVAAIAEGAGCADDVSPGGRADRFEELRPLLVVLEVPG